METKENSGVLFKNDDKTAANPKWPDYKGLINIEGKEFWLSAWVNTAKQSDKKYLAINVKPKDQPAAQARPAAGENSKDDNDDLPF